MDPFKIFLITDPARRIAEIVFRYSLHRRTGMPLEIREIKQADRFGAPALCGYQGRAIVMHSGSVCYADIAELANLKMTSPAMICAVKGYENHLMLVDCEKLKHWPPELSGIPGQGKDYSPLDSMWNQYDQYPLGTKIIHYAGVPLAHPWLKPGHPYASAFLKELRSALDNGVIQQATVLEEEAKKSVYTGLLKDALSA